MFFVRVSFAYSLCYMYAMGRDVMCDQNFKIEFIISVYIILVSID